MDKAKAKQHFQNAIEMSFQKEKIQEKYQEIDQAILLDPDNLEYLWFRINHRELDMTSGDYPINKANLILEDIDKYLELATDLDDLISGHLCRALVYSRMSDFDNFMVEIEWLIQHSNKPSYYLWKAEVLLQYKHYEQALSIVENDFLLKLKDAHEAADAMSVRIRSLYYLKRYKQLIKDVNNYFQKPAKKKEVFHYWRGFALYELGRKQKALEDFNLFLTLTRKKTVRNADEFVKMFPKPKK
jgi:tetratricopeptide (TPR) repeat protein